MGWWNGRGGKKPNGDVNPSGGEPGRRASVPDGESKTRGRMGAGQAAVRDPASRAGLGPSQVVAGLGGEGRDGLKSGLRPSLVPRSDMSPGFGGGKSGLRPSLVPRSDMGSMRGGFRAKFRVEKDID